MGIEPTSEAWEAYLKARKRTNWRHFCVFRPSSNGFQLEQRRANTWIEFESRVRSVLGCHPGSPVLTRDKPDDSAGDPQMAGGCQLTTHMSCLGGFQSRWPLETADYLSAWSTTGSSCGAQEPENADWLGMDLSGPRYPTPRCCRTLRSWSSRVCPG